MDNHIEIYTETGTALPAKAACLITATNKPLSKAIKAQLLK